MSFAPFFGEADPPAKPERYPNRPGAKKRDTSFAAADAMAPKAGNLRERVLAEIRRCASTADEIAARLGETILAVRPRTTELSKLSQIEDSGERRKNASGRAAIVWRAAQS
jgi:hypothetical protein